MEVVVAVAVLVAVLFSVHFTWSMCFETVDSMAAAVFASDGGATAGAIPVKGKKTSASPVRLQGLHVQARGCP